jgi:hypothetical protein
MLQNLVLLGATLLGSAAPDFMLFTPDGRPWRLSEMLLDRPVVVLNDSDCVEKLKVPESIRVVALRPSVCGGYRDHTGAARRFLGATKAVLIDKTRVVRVIAGPDLAAFESAVASWRPEPPRCSLCHFTDKLPRQ